MRVLVVALVSLGFLGLKPVVPLAAEALASRGDVAAPVIQVPSAPAELTRPLAEPQGPSLTIQEVATGAVVVGGAFVIGLVAGGTLSTAIVSAGAVILIYGLLP